MGNTNAGIAYNWQKQFEAFDITYYSYTLLTVLLAHFFVFRKFYYARPRWKLALAITGLLVFYIVFRYLLEEVLMPQLVGTGNYRPSTTIRFYIIDNIYFGSIKIFIGFVFFLFDELFRQHRQKVELLEQHRKAELNFLQAQMNPHFLFNSLNNIYSLAYEQHPQTATAVLKLSDMMRYVTYEKEKNTSLEKETGYIRNLLEIEQLRRDYKLNYRLQVAEEATACQVMPLLLFPLAENAIKHGDLADPLYPFIITAEKTGTKLKLTVANKINSRPPATGGVGLKNLQRRLELSFRPEEYSFIAGQKDNIFTVQLLIPVF